MGSNATVWKENHEKIKENLVRAYKGISRGRLAARAHLSRPTVNGHLEEFKRAGQIKIEGRLIYWKASYQRYPSWLQAFDLIVDKLNQCGLAGEWLKETQGVVITPQVIGFAPATPEKLKTLVDRMWGSDVPPGGIVALVKSAGKIDQWADVRAVGIDAQNFILVTQANIGNKKEQTNSGDC